MTKRHCYNEITLLRDYSQRLYKEYLNSDKKFIYASILREINGRLYERLHEGLRFLEGNSHIDAIELMLHLNVWMTIWDYEYEEQKPGLGDVFTFKNDVNFPKENVNQLLSELANFGE
jgi:hypothetical protein